MSDDVRDPDLSGEDRLPWLEAVEEEEDRDGPSAAKLAAAIIIGLVAIGIIVGGLFWLGNRGQEDGDGTLIAAEEGDYKVKPADPGGMEVADQAGTAQSAAQGAEPQGRLDTGAVPEAPVTRPPAAAQPQPQPKAPPRPAAPAASAGPTIQLGAFSSQARATQAWNALSGRFGYLAPLSHSVVPVQAGGRTLYRLRATGPDSAGICGRLLVAGEACSVVG